MGLVESISILKVLARKRKSGKKIKLSIRECKSIVYSHHRSYRKKTIVNGQKLNLYIDHPLSLTCQDLRRVIHFSSAFY